MTPLSCWGLQLSRPISPPRWKATCQRGRGRPGAPELSRGELFACPPPSSLPPPCSSPSSSPPPPSPFPVPSTSSPSTCRSPSKPLPSPPLRVPPLLSPLALVQDPPNPLPSPPLCVPPLLSPLPLVQEASRLSVPAPSPRELAWGGGRFSGRVRCGRILLKCRFPGPQGGPRT